MEDQDAKDARIESMADAGELRELVLRRFLRELVEREGKLEAAEALGVNYKTLARHEKSGELTARLGQALELLLLSRDERTGDGGDNEGQEQYRRLERRVAALEEVVKELRRELRSGGRAGGTAVASGETASVVGKSAPAPAGDADLTETYAAPPVEGLGLNARPRPTRRKYPELVTVEPANDDTEVYGDAWPLVQKYRKLRDGHPRVGRGLAWLTMEEKLLTVELALLEEHGLTLPPAEYPAVGFARRNQTRWRWKALANTRKALARRFILRWLRRALAMGRWRK
ncbi:MAG: hypothetical protein F4X66_07835 [Chloroflexi bacterium]|nr:hypothetical protein [Chloroflexota bacterium]